MSLPREMPAAVYRGPGQMPIETVPVPAIGPGEVLVAVTACGVCGTDLKKIQLGLQPPPRIYGHETVGAIAALGEGVTGWRIGQRVALYHHIPCGDCHYCRRGVPSQCPVYKRTGVTAGFEPAGGGYAQFVRVMDWIVAGGGLVAVPEGVSDRAATFVEPVNTCLKAATRAELQPGDTAWVIGGGPIGQLLAQAARLAGARVVLSDPLPGRRALATRLGSAAAVEPAAAAAAVAELSEGRGADAVFLAVPAAALTATALAGARAGGRVVLFAQTRFDDPVTLDAGQIGVLDKVVLGAYSSDLTLNEAAAAAVFGGAIAVEPLVTHRFPLAQIDRAIAVASAPSDESSKVVVEL
jgi:L-iditol 2-dehydrogenase